MSIEHNIHILRKPTFGINRSPTRRLPSLAMHMMDEKTNEVGNVPIHSLDSYISHSLHILFEHIVAGMKHYCCQLYPCWLRFTFEPRPVPEDPYGAP